MSVLLKKFNFNFYENVNSSLSVFIRNGHHLRGKPPGVAKSLKEKIEEQNFRDPTIHYRVDIGLAPPQKLTAKEQEERLKVLKAQRNSPELEKLSRTRELRIDLEKANEDWLKTVGPQHIKKIADHYGIFEHLFGDAYFIPQVPLKILYLKDDLKLPVYFGNHLKPDETTQKPEITFESDENSLWTLILTNPDGHFTNSNREYVHWFIGNIPGNAVEKGETIIDYIQPFPPKGTGYHRHIFILYKQNKSLDFSAFKKEGKCLNLPERTFHTYDFYKDLQDEITPAGLAFFQADWSPSLKEFYNKVLDMKEPIFEYDFPPPYIRKQEWFPKRRPFNLYMDKYRDPKQINKEFLVRKLQNVHPFKPPPEPVPYPNAQYIEAHVPSWLKLEIIKSRMKWGRINEIE